MATARFWEYLMRGETGEPELCQDFDMKVYKLAKKLGHEIRIDSVPGKGTTVEIVIQD